MSEQQKQPWRPGKRDFIFLLIVAAVILLLVVGSSERKTVPVPSDDVHRHASSRTACMSCHGADGAHPQPEGHTKADQCFQCHAEPEGWVGAAR